MNNNKPASTTSKQCKWNSICDFFSIDLLSNYEKMLVGKYPKPSQFVRIRSKLLSGYRRCYTFLAERFLYTKMTLQTYNTGK